MVYQLSLWGHCLQHTLKRHPFQTATQKLLETKANGNSLFSAQLPEPFNTFFFFKDRLALNSLSSCLVTGVHHHAQQILPSCLRFRGT